MGKYFIKLFKKKHKTDMSKDKRAMQKLRRESERVKRALSTQPQARAEIEALFDGIDFSESLTRARFEELNNDLFKKTLGPVGKVMSDAGLKKSEVDELVLVGGSTRIPKVKSLLKDYFNGKTPNTGINPDEAVAYGAAVQGGILSGEGDETTKDILLLDVTFEIDANGILQVSAEDKGTGKAEKITITAEKGRLSEEEIERMVQEAEEFAEEDKKTKERIDSRNGLESYLYNLKNTLEDEEKGIADKISEEDKETLEEAIKEALEWLDDNQEAEKEDYEAKQKELEGVANPIIQAVYPANGGGEGGEDGEEEDAEDEDEDEL